MSETVSPAPQLLRDRSGAQRVTNVELFFDLVYGPALFLAGHAAFKFVVWRVVSWPRLAGIAALALLALAARAIPALALAACTAAVVIAVAATDRLPLTPHLEGTEGPDAPEGSADPEEPDRLDPDLAAG